MLEHNNPHTLTEDETALKEWRQLRGRVQKGIWPQETKKFHPGTYPVTLHLPHDLTEWYVKTLAGRFDSHIDLEVCIVRAMEYYQRHFQDGTMDKDAEFKDDNPFE